VKVIDEQGNETQFHDLRDFIKHFRIWNISNSERLIEVAKTRYPHLKFIIIDNYQFVPIQALEIGTGKVLETKTISEMSNLTGVAKYKIRRAIRSSNKWSYSGFVFRYKTEDSWGTDFVNKDIKRSIPVKATNLITNQEIIFDSLRNVQRTLKLDPRYFQKD